MSGIKTLDEKAFKHITIESFNTRYDVEATKEMDIMEFTEYIEENDLRYFYASYNYLDVLSAIEDEWDVTKNMEFHYLCVENLYIAIY